MQPWEKFQLVGCKNLKFGCKTNPKRIEAKGTDVSPSNWRIIEYYPGLEASQNQYLNSCVAEATVNLLEWHIFMRTSKRVHLDGAAVFRAARKLYYDGSDDDGLCVEDAAKALVAMRVLPTSTVINRVRAHSDDMIKALYASPVVTGHLIWDGWFPANLEPDNGCVDESQGGQTGMGHATLCVGTNLHNGTHLFVHQNSWGDYPPMKGLFAMSCSYSCANMIDDALQLLIPDGWEKGEPWKKIQI